MQKYSTFAPFTPALQGRISEETLLQSPSPFFPVKNERPRVLGEQKGAERCTVEKCTRSGHCTEPLLLQLPPLRKATVFSSDKRYFPVPEGSVNKGTSDGVIRSLAKPGSK